MPWLQFFDEEGALIREFQLSKQAIIKVDEGGTTVLDEFAQDTANNPRVVMIREAYAFAKSISEDARANQLVEAAQERLEAKAAAKADAESPSAPEGNTDVIPHGKLDVDRHPLYLPDDSARAVDDEPKA